MIDKKAVKAFQLKYKFCVSGAAVTKHCADSCLARTKELGREIVRQNGILVTGATWGVPHWSAIGCKEEGGFSIGISPAATEIAHVKSYKLPVEYYDMIMYTGFEYSGRNLLLTRSSDAVITVCGRIGTLNEFTIAFEDNKPQGILVASGGTADMVKDILEKSHRGMGKIIFEKDPKTLIEKLRVLVDKEKTHKIR